MRVSARLHATAAPDAPEPMIRTSTLSCMEPPPGLGAPKGPLMYFRLDCFNRRLRLRP